MPRQKYLVVSELDSTFLSSRFPYAEPLPSSSLSSIPCFLCFSLCPCEMGFDSRRLLQAQKNCTASSPGTQVGPLTDKPSGIITPGPPSGIVTPRTPSRIVTPRPRDDNILHKRLLLGSMTIMGCVVGAAILLAVLWMVVKVYYARHRNTRRTRSAPIFFGTQEDFVGDEQGPEIGHPIWYINTVGLHQSLIDSITAFTYKKDEGLIEGTECSICLNEFQEDERVRLLPKCSHAFHAPCIDTWLRSHKNCPFCRAPIVCENFYAQVALSVPRTSDLSSREESQMENSEGNTGSVSSNQITEDAAREWRNENDNLRVFPAEDETHAENSNMNENESVLKGDCRVQIDVINTSQEQEAKMQPERRSLSLDDSSASAIYNAMATVVPGKEKGDSDSQLARPKSSKSKNGANRGGSGNLSICKLMESSSIGRSLQKRPISMKRSFSTSWKPSSSGHSRRQSSVRYF